MFEGFQPQLLGFLPLFFLYFHNVELSVKENRTQSRNTTELLQESLLNVGKGSDSSVWIICGVAILMIIVMIARIHRCVSLR